MNKWYRIKDGASPFYGMDFLCEDYDEKLFRVTSVRKIDVFVGDRPLTIPLVEGIYLSQESLVESPFQGDEIVFEHAKASSHPYGKLQRVETLNLVHGMIAEIEQRMLATKICILDYFGKTVCNSGYVLGQFDLIRLENLVLDFENKEEVIEKIVHKTVFEKARIDG